jgi:hypothetical protein
MKHYYGIYFLFILLLKRALSARMTVPPAEDFTRPAVYVCHYQDGFGVTNALTFFPIFVHVWVYEALFSAKSCFHNARNITFKERYKLPGFLAVFYAAFIALFTPPLMRSARAIPVYRANSRDRTKMHSTFELSAQALAEGECVLLFADIEYNSDSAQTGQLYSGFTRVDKEYYELTGKHVPFIPVYCSKFRRKLLLGDAVYIESENPTRKERKAVAENIQQQLNKLAVICHDV